MVVIYIIMDICDNLVAQFYLYLIIVNCIEVF